MKEEGGVLINEEQDLMWLLSLLCGPAVVSRWVMEQEVMLQSEVYIEGSARLRTNEV